jgi:hypothetical protein
MRPEIALVQTGADVDVAGRGYDEFTDAQRDSVVVAFSRNPTSSTELLTPSIRA